MTETSRLLEMEAAVFLVLARVAIRIVPFRWLVLWFDRTPRGRELRGPARHKTRREVRQAIVGASRRLPGKTVCFPQAIAAQTMLRRRGVGAVLYCGAAAQAPTGLRAHAWVRDGRAPVVGVAQSPGYLVLASYPRRSNRRSDVYVRA